MQIIDLKEFEEFVAQRDLVPEKYRSYYLGWVRRFLQAQFTVDELSNRDRIACFADQLARDASVEEWQQRQATEAVQLYLNVYLPEANSERPSLEEIAKADGPTGVPGEAVEAGNKMRELLRLRHYAYRTEQTYMEWVVRYLKYVNEQRLNWKATGSLRSFLSYLALQRKVAASTQNQAFSALLFLFQEVLAMEVPEVDAVRARRGRKLPVVLSTGEVKSLLDQLEGTKRLMLALGV